MITTITIIYNLHALYEYFVFLRTQRSLS